MNPPKFEKPASQILEERIKELETQLAALKQTETAWRIGYNSAIETCRSERPDIYNLANLIAIRNLAEGRDIYFEERLPEPYDTIP